MNRQGAWWVIVGLGAVSAGCGQILGIDKDYHPVDQGEGGAPTAASASGTGGAPADASAAGAGGASADASAGATTSVSTSAASSSSGGACLPQGSPDSLCGPDGKDDNCNTVVGDCDDLQTVYVGMKVADVNDCTSKATDFRISTNEGDLPTDFPVVAQFKTFTQKPSGTHVIELSTCLGAGGKHIVSFGPTSCTPSSSEYKSLGYVSTKPGNGYEQLLVANIMGITTVFPASANGVGNKVCCHTTCSLVSEYVLQ